MLRNLNDLENDSINATDGDIGHIKDFYFDDDAWAVRYLVVETGTWLSSRKVLISPISVAHPDWQGNALTVSLSRDRVRNSPDIDTDKPVSRQAEEGYLNYYGFPYYWGGGGMWGEGLYPYSMNPGYTGYAVDDGERERDLELYRRDYETRHRNDDPHLRSVKAVTGYHIHTTDGHVGHVSGFLVETETWAIRYLVLDTSNWWLGHKVLVSPRWVTAVQWPDQIVMIDLDRELIRNAPTYDPSVALSRDQESEIYQHYGRTGYWVGKPTPGHAG